MRFPWHLFSCLNGDRFSSARLNIRKHFGRQQDMANYSLEQLIRKYRNDYYSFCKSYQGECTSKIGCACSTLAQMYAYIDYIIPSPYNRMSIENFDGRIIKENGEPFQIIMDNDVARIKNEFSKYCWRGIKCESLPSREEIDKASQMDERFEQGKNLVIHGKNKVDVNGKTLPMPTGKTMLASLVLKEAILRMRFRTNMASHYGYTTFATVRKYAKESAKDKNEGEQFGDILRAKHWLIIDDIPPVVHAGSGAQIRYINESVDDFLGIRVEYKLPTILVFSYNIDIANLSEDYGYIIDKIVNGQDTMRILV